MRVTFASLGTLGDLHPLLAVARAVQNRGDDVTIASSKGFGGYVVSLGFRFCPIRPDLEPGFGQVSWLSDPARGPERLLREEVFPSVRQTYGDLLEACRTADLLVVGELVYVAPLVAAKTGIPWVNAVLSPSSFLSSLDPCVLAPAPAFHHLRHFGPLPHRLLLGYGDRLTSRWAEPLYMFRRKLGFAPGRNPVYHDKHSPHLTLALFPKLFAAPQSDWPPQVRQTGFPFFEQPPQATDSLPIESFLDAGSPPLVFTLGSSMVGIAGDFYAEAARAAAALGRRAILLIGKNPPPTGLPDSILPVAYAPLESIFPRAAAVIHHGGIGSCAMALRCGVPSLVIPFAYDQPDNAERLRKLGVARTLKRSRASAGSLVRMLNQVLDNHRMRADALQLAHRITPDKDLSLTIQALDNLVQPA
ncbi:MAG: glycosyltransferase [Verrucomicrobia bacterium]|nr:glycosyltransferase [Verrucomicrobiota bacterium]